MGMAVHHGVKGADGMGVHQAMGQREQTGFTECIIEEGIMHLNCVGITGLGHVS